MFSIQPTTAALPRARRNRAARPFLHLFAMIFAFAAPGYVVAQSNEASSVFALASASVVVVEATEAKRQGSGVVVQRSYEGLAPAATIVTNCHVVKGLQSVTVIRQGRSATAMVLGCDTERDIAFLRASADLPPVKLRDASTLSVGEPVYAIGAPRGLELSVSVGIVSQLRRPNANEPPLIQTTAAISPGSSGGGLFDAKGQLVGITTMNLEGGQSLNFAVPSEWIRSARVQAPSATKDSAATTDSTSSQCGWVPVGHSADSAFQMYLDPCEVKRIGSYVMAWTLTEFRSMQRSQRGEYRSSVERRAIDCTSGLSALTSITLRTGTMGTGEPLASMTRPTERWNFQDAAPGTMDRLVIEGICGLQPR